MVRGKREPAERGKDCLPRQKSFQHRGVADKKSAGLTENDHVL